MKYPFFLQCISYLSSRSKYCVKEVSTLTQNLCGATQYFGDMYVNRECVFKKCSDECVEETYTFQFEGQTYSRDRYCCKSDYCNAAVKGNVANWTLVAGLIAMLYGIFIWMQ